jgi:hypothetical protein
MTLSYVHQRTVVSKTVNDDWIELSITRMHTVCHICTDQINYWYMIR